MTKAVGRNKQAALVQDLLEARLDVVELAQRHRLSPQELSAWGRVGENQQCVSGLCRLADLQAQFLLSRYRLLAVTQLIKQATQQADDGEAVSSEQARKACVDLLRADLQVRDLGPAEPEEAKVPPLRGSLYEALEQERRPEREEAS